MNRRKKIAIVTIAGLVVIPLVFYSLPYERRRDGCIQCRLVKRIDSYCGISITREIPNECSQWYMQTHPDHQHEWAKGGCTYRRCGLSVEWRCGGEHHVFGIIPEMQKAFLSSCTPQQEAQWFELLGSRKQEDCEKAEKMAADVFFGESTPG
jgi:hypothetical protein